MPLSDAHTKTVGFIVGNGQAVGTFFVVQKAGKCYMVTAAHNLIGYNDSKARIRVHSGKALHEWDPGPWFYPDLDGCLDLAVNCFDPASDALFTAVPIDEQGVDALHAPPMLGTAVYFAGLLSPVPTMGEAGVPMVRSGTVGALYQTNVVYEDGAWGPFTAHLIDTRSWGGFSGAPVWSQLTYPGPTLKQKPDRLMADVPDHIKEGLGDLHFITTFLGMFLGHARNSGAGVVMPVETIRAALEREELSEMCADRGDCRETTRQRLEESDEIKADTTRYQRDEFLSDLEKATRRLPEQPDQES